MLKQSLIGIFAASLILAGCGDSGGSSAPSYTGPTGVISITSTSEGDSATALALSEALDNGMSTLSGTYTPFAPGPVSVSPPNLTALAKKYGEMAMKLDVSALAAAPTGVTASQTFACSVSGNITATATASDPYAYPQAGDSVSYTFNSCVESPGIVLTGSLGLTINSYTSGSAFSATYSYNRLKVTQTSTGNYGLIHGGYTASITDTGSLFTGSLTGTSMYTESSTGGVVQQAELSNFSYVDTLDTSWNVTLDHDFTVASTEIGGSITATTVTKFTIYYPDLYPTSGELIVTGANNAKVRLTAVDNTSVTLEYDLDGNGTYEVGPTTVAWSSL